MIRIGIEGKREPILNKIRSLNMSVLVSANSLWDNDRKRFTVGWKHYAGLDVALDSGGFVAMKRYGGYRFSVESYVGLAKVMQPTWWAQMDFCCEPEIASRRHEVFARIDATIKHLHQCNASASAASCPWPMPVLQGWRPEDYTSGPAWDSSFQWPELVGVGSVCRRHLHGEHGLLKVISALDQKLPPHVRLHFFGVKGCALKYLREHPRFASMDSMAWNYTSRIKLRKTGERSTNENRARFIEPWVNAQTRTDGQLHLKL